MLPLSRVGFLNGEHRRWLSGQAAGIPNDGGRPGFGIGTSARTWGSCVASGLTLTIAKSALRQALRQAQRLGSTNLVCDLSAAGFRVSPRREKKPRRPLRRDESRLRGTPGNTEAREEVPTYSATAAPAQQHQADGRSRRARAGVERIGLVVDTGARHCAAAGHCAPVQLGRADADGELRIIADGVGAARHLAVVDLHRV